MSGYAEVEEINLLSCFSNFFFYFSFIKNLEMAWKKKYKNKQTPNYRRSRFTHCSPSYINVTNIIINSIYQKHTVWMQNNMVRVDFFPKLQLVFSCLSNKRNGNMKNFLLLPFCTANGIS